MSTKRERDAFTQGFAYACANVARYHGEDTLAEYLLEEAGISRGDLEAAGVEPEDMEALSVALACLDDRARKTA